MGVRTIAVTMVLVGRMPEQIFLIQDLSVSVKLDTTGVDVIEV